MLEKKTRNYTEAQLKQIIIDLRKQLIVYMEEEEGGDAKQRIENLQLALSNTQTELRELKKENVELTEQNKKLSETISALKQGKKPSETKQGKLKQENWFERNLRELQTSQNKQISPTPIPNQSRIMSQSFIQFPQKKS